MLRFQVNCCETSIHNNLGVPLFRSITESIGSTIIDSSSSGSGQDPFIVEPLGVSIHDRLELDLDIAESIEEIQLSRLRTGLWDSIEHRIEEYSQGIALVEFLQNLQPQCSCSHTLPMAALVLFQVLVLQRRG